MSDIPEAVAGLSPVFGPILGLLCMGAAIRTARRERLISNLPTSKTTGAFIGMVELKGTAEIETPLVSRLANIQCVWYSWSVAEEWSRTVTETYRDDDGRTQTRTRTESGWTTVASGKAEPSFYLKDDEGIIRIVPENAEIEPVETMDETCDRLSPLYYSAGPKSSIPDSTNMRRYYEQAIPLHVPLYVMGQARERKDAIAPEIAADPAASMFLISTRSEEAVESSMGRSFWLWLLLGLVLTLVGLAIGITGYKGRLSDHVPDLIFATIVYVFIAIVRWGIMVFNSLIDLRQRVRQGWSQVDVQLKRRHDLINNLVTTVRGLRTYESSLQTELAVLRSQLTATPPGKKGPDFHSVGDVVTAMSERYPDLIAQKSFANLQQNLIDTEQRIALARSYFNEIASHYNARLEIIPDRFLALLAFLRHQPLLVAEDFERAPVEVKLAD